MVSSPPGSGPVAMDMGPAAHQAFAAAAQHVQHAALHVGGPAPHALVPPVHGATMLAQGGTLGMAAGPPAERQQEPAQARSVPAAGDAAVSAAFAQEKRAGALPSLSAAVNLGTGRGCPPEGGGLQSDPDPFSMYPRRAADTGAASAAALEPARPSCAGATECSCYRSCRRRHEQRAACSCVAGHAAAAGHACH